MKKLILILLILLLVSIIAYTLRESPHEFTESECGKCHIDVDNKPKILTAPVEQLCNNCHRKGLSSASHPVNIKPAITRVPEDMPLTDGLLTCNTCHNVHAKRFTPFGDKSNFLRRPVSGREFCISCHETNPIETGHSGLLDAAHMSRKYRVTAEAQPLDNMSLECIGCHDGTVGKNADYVLGVGYWKHMEGSHPIGVDYKKSRMKSGGLVPLSQLDSRVRLFNGKIGCGTCHDPFSKLPGQLVMANNDSRLCSECHYDK